MSDARNGVPETHLNSLITPSPGHELLSVQRPDRSEFLRVFCGETDFLQRLQKCQWFRELKSACAENALQPLEGD